MWRKGNPPEGHLFNLPDCWESDRLISLQVGYADIHDDLFREDVVKELHRTEPN
jgi:hypothetical protein